MYLYIPSIILIFCLGVGCGVKKPGGNTSNLKTISTTTPPETTTTTPETTTPQELGSEPTTVHTCAFENTSENVNAGDNVGFKVNTSSAFQSFKITKVQNNAETPVNGFVNGSSIIQQSQLQVTSNFILRAEFTSSSGNFQCQKSVNIESPPPVTPTPSTGAENNPTSINTCEVRTQNEQTTFINDKRTNRKDALSGSIMVNTTQAALDVKLSFLNRNISPIEQSLNLFPHGFNAATNIHQENYNVFEDHWTPYANTRATLTHAAELIARVRTINATFECRKTILLQIKQ